MSSAELFVYGTLRHDQPENERFIPPHTPWQRARVRGRLVTIPSGYDLLVVPAAGVLGEATRDAGADEARRAAVMPDATRRAFAAMGKVDGETIAGELLTLRDAAAAWPPIDGWEDFVPGRSGAYARLVVPVECGDESGHWRLLAAWVYAATRAPAGSFRRMR
jgi:gamma-glutamylcyclotransferase (GGCT)/AIG2-like uncharacterized protein YtfP